MGPRHIWEATRSLCEPQPSWVVSDKFVQQVFTAHVPSAGCEGGEGPSPAVHEAVRGFISLPCFYPPPTPHRARMFRSLGGHWGQERDGARCPSSADRLDFNFRESTLSCHSPSQRSHLNCKNPGSKCFQQPNREDRRETEGIFQSLP